MTAQRASLGASTSLVYAIDRFPSLLRHHVRSSLCEGKGRSGYSGQDRDPLKTQSEGLALSSEIADRFIRWTVCHSLSTNMARA
jgi:hypothetical protein